MDASQTGRTICVPGEFTLILQQLRTGNPAAQAEFLPMVYGELRSLAAHYMRNERSGHTLQPTAVVHEVFLRLSGTAQVNWQDRAHFFAIAARLMRQVLVDHARVRHAGKRGGHAVRIPIEDVLQISPETIDGMLELDRALTRLSELDAEAARVVELRFIVGLSAEETAEVMKISERQVVRKWATARLWLRRELETRGAP
jgi:RNA polymerase sigma-70 factor (ECF subfamily)